MKLPTGMFQAVRRRREYTRDETIQYHNRNLLLTLAFLTVWCTGSYIFVFRPFNWTVRVNEDNQDWTQSEQNFISKDNFAEMQKKLVNGELAMAPNAWTAVTDGKTTGVVLSFNLKGEEELRSQFAGSSGLPEILQVLDKVRIHGSNAYVVSLLRIQGDRGPARDGEQRHRELRDRELQAGGQVRGAAGLRSLLSRGVGAAPADPHSEAGAHWDDSLKANRRLLGHVSFVSYKTTVLYLQIPADMAPSGAFIILAQRQDSSIAHLDILPFENMVLHYRGDLRHYVNGFSSKTGMARVSLSIQQYCVPPKQYPRVQQLWTSVPLRRDHD